MKLIPLKVGKIDASLKIITGEAGSVTLPITSWLIDHPQGLVLFDNGMHQGLQHDTTRLGQTLDFFRPDYHPGEEVSARLAERGVAPQDIDLMIFSHLHFDHAGGTEQIPDARIVINRTEWEAGQSQQLIERGVYDPLDYDHGHEVQQVDGQHDVFGDGKLVCIPTPGHTPGHQALRVELESGPVVLTGDCVYFERMLDEMLVPRFGYNPEMQRQSMEQLSELRDQGCRMLYGHDEHQLSSLPESGVQ